MIKIYGVVIGVLLALSTGQAKTILISDIDDTIKNSHVLDNSDALANSMKTENLVLGMNFVYEAVKRADNTIPFYYVTNAPKSLMETSHSEFLSLNNFPVGSLHLRESIFQQDFKVKEIRKILQQQRPDTAVLIGDNGEKDPWIYAQIKSEFPQIQFLIFIRQAYSVLNPEDTGMKLLAGQTGFATAMDLVLQLRQKNLTTKADAVSFINSFISVYSQEDEMNDSGPQAIPFWFDCRDFQWTAYDSEFMTSPGYVNTKARILDRCSLPGFEED